MTGKCVIDFRIEEPTKDKIMNTSTSKNVTPTQTDTAINWKRGSVFIFLVVLMGLVAALTLLSVAAYVAEWIRHMNSAAAKS